MLQNEVYNKKYPHILEYVFICFVGTLEQVWT